MEIAKNRTPVDELLGFRKLVQGVHQGLCGQIISNATTHEAQGQEIHVE